MNQVKHDTTSGDHVISTSIEALNTEHWNAVDSNNIYLSIEYLKALETGLPSFSFRYILFYNEHQQPIGIAYCQIVKITSREISAEALSNRMGKLPGHLINSLDIRVLINGNAFATGENGFYFTPEVETADAMTRIAHAIDEINDVEKKKNRKIGISLIKEFWPEHFHWSQGLKHYGCSEVNIDVNMILKLDAEWTSFDDYLKAMTSKFRTKANRVFKISEPLEVVDFNIDNLKDREREVEELYNAIVDKAPFTFGRLNGVTLTNMKRALADQFFFRGYYLEGKLIAFATATSFNDVLDGNFIGLNYDYNQEYGVYQRILYDFVQHAFDIGAREIRIGRTAEEIKSGIGAMPTEMKFYARHRNRVTNALLRPFVQNLRPSSFNLRKPFKAKYYK